MFIFGLTVRRRDSNSRPKRRCQLQSLQPCQQSLLPISNHLVLTDCSMDQSDPLPYIQSLPLYVATCNDLLCFETPDYHERAWCRVEVTIHDSHMHRF